MEKVELKGAGTVIEADTQRNLDLLAEVVERLGVLTTKEAVLEVVDDAYSRGAIRGEASAKREKAIEELRKVIAGEEQNG